MTLVIVTTPTLSVFQVIVSPVFFVKPIATAKNRLSSGCHPLDGVTRGGRPPPLLTSHSDVTNKHGKTCRISVFSTQQLQVNNS